MLDFLDKLGIAENTFVQYSTDNGPHCNTWPDAGTTPFRSEKNTNWEGAFRVPLIVRWPGKIKAGSISNEIVQHHDWLPTFLAMAGASDVIDKLTKGYKAIGRTYKNHIDGLNLLPYLTGQEQKSPRDFFFYFSDDGDMLAVRMHNFKIMFMEQRTSGTLAVWQDPFVPLRAPNIYNLRTDPFEFATVTSNTYYEWMFHHAFCAYAAQAVTGKFLETFKEFPPVQKPNTFTVDQALEKMSQSASAGN
jgi:arylsulfatase